MTGAYKRTGTHTGYCSASFLAGDGLGAADWMGVAKKRGVGVCSFACNFNVSSLTALPRT